MTQTSDRLKRLMGYLKADPFNTTLLHDTVTCAIDYDNLEDCGIELLKLVLLHPNPPANLLAHATLLALKCNQPADAAKLGESALSAGAQDSTLIFNTAYAHLCIGNAAKAATLTDLTLSSSITPELIILKARALHHLERPEEAQTILMELLNAEPQNSDAAGLLALLLHEDGKNSEAQVFANNSLALNAKQHEAMLAIAGCHLESGNNEAATSIYNSVTEVYPHSGRAWLGLGQIAFDNLDFDCAERHMRNAVTHMPNHIGSWHLLAWIFILRGDADIAEQLLEKSYELDKSFAETHGGFAVVDVMRGNIESARIRIKKANRLDPACMSSRYAEFLLLKKSGNEEAAHKLVEQTLDIPLQNGLTSRRSLVTAKIEVLKSFSGQSMRQKGKQHV